MWLFSHHSVIWEAEERLGHQLDTHYGSSYLAKYLWLRERWFYYHRKLNEVSLVLVLRKPHVVYKERVIDLRFIESYMDSTVVMSSWQTLEDFVLYYHTTND